MILFGFCCRQSHKIFFYFWFLDVFMVWNHPPSFKNFLKAFFKCSFKYEPKPYLSFIFFAYSFHFDAVTASALKTLFAFLAFVLARQTFSAFLFGSCAFAISAHSYPLHFWIWNCALPCIYLWCCVAFDFDVTAVSARCLCKFHFNGIIIRVNICEMAPFLFLLLHRFGGVTYTPARSVSSSWNHSIQGEME